MDFNIKDIVKDNFANFDYYSDGNLVYSIRYNGELYNFNVPIEEAKGGVFSAVMKAITLMRFIRKSIENSEFRKV